MRPLLKNPAAAGKDADFTIVTRGPKQRGDTIRTERWRYTEWGDGQRELYDHDNDAQEARDVAAANAEIVNELSRHLALSRARRAD